MAKKPSPFHKGMRKDLLPVLERLYEVRFSELPKREWQATEGILGYIADQYEITCTDFAKIIQYCIDEEEFTPSETWGGYDLDIVMQDMWKCTRSINRYYRSLEELDRAKKSKKVKNTTYKIKKKSDYRPLPLHLIGDEELE